MGVSPVRLNHAVLYVTDLDRSVRFYTESSAWRSSPGSPGPTRRSSGRRVGEPPRPRPVRGRHPGEDAGGRRPLPPGVAGGHDRRARRGAGCARRGRRLTGESNHGATKSLYGADPDGIEFEVMWMLPRDDWGDYEHTATVEPLDLRSELARWSGVRTGAGSG